MVMGGICTAHHGARWGPLWHTFHHRMKISGDLRAVEPSMQLNANQLPFTIQVSCHVSVVSAPPCELSSDGGRRSSATRQRDRVFCVTHPAHSRGIWGGSCAAMCAADSQYHLPLHKHGSLLRSRLDPEPSQLAHSFLFHTQTQTLTECVLVFFV